VVFVLFVGMLGLMAVSVTQRARAQRSQAAASAATAPATAPAVAEESPPELKPLRPADQAALPPKPAVRETAPQPKPKPHQPTFDVARIRAGKSVDVRTKPGGRVITSVGSTTEFGSPTTLSVAKRRGAWLGVTSTALPNGTIGWVKRSRAALAPASTRLSIRIDLSKRRLELRSGRRLVRRASVGIGRPGSETPTGRFAVTDKLRNTYGPFYGCCIVALSGHQPHTPPGWTGGNRLAIHGTDNPASIGVPSSAGCLHADADDLKVLMRRVPLGTPVFIRR
jgi:lipoprotein-anchoring transpeptidase ErfK/SrfK